MHDESHDGLEVVSVERDLRLLGHVDTTGMPRPLAIPQTLKTLAPIGRLKSIHSSCKTAKQTSNYQ